MTDHHHPGDRRRATALLCHWGTHNIEGINAVIGEAKEANRIGLLLHEILALHSELAPVLLTEDGIACASHEAYKVATIPIADDEDSGVGDCRRAAQLMFGYAQQDASEISSVIDEAIHLDRVTELFLTLLELYRRIIPQLYTELGLQVLGRTVLQWAAREQEQEQGS